MPNSSLRAKTDLSELVRVLTWFDEFTQSSLPETTFMQCQTLLAEGFTNAVRHAHQSKAIDLPIDLELQLSEQQIEMRIWDYGEPFDLLQKVKSLPEKVDTNSTGGRGLKLLEQIADGFSYRRDNQRNCLVMIKQW
ncbi:MAG: ATP-binding protein [Oscillatoriophycideae cyanobacterium NC_groundwater_1537_Pr4_S-0.65um_50_18]|nr:ATP-binding protein [Oscillatoriophycideae cyanobacterium NC_groundwater_1537_Pr4_S-0.65um_50_18]